jgi:hypothetical protein
MEKARDDLINLLREYRRPGIHDITVVFDGHRSGAGAEQATVRGGIRVVYSRIAESADEVIARIIKTERREWIVVTSDRAVAHHAWAANSIPVPSDRFLDLVSGEAKRRSVHGDDAGGRLRGEGDLYGKEGDDVDETPGPRRGNSRHLSKKEKAVRRALARLATGS